MANTTEDIINQMSQEDFFQYAVTGLKAKGKCGLCSECALDYSYFRENFGVSDFEGGNSCSSILGYIGKRLEKELATLKITEPEKEKPETGNCSSCIYYRDYSGTGFCEIWHNFTQPYVYCSFHNAKEAFCCYHEPTEPIIINDMPGIELDAVKG